MIIFHTFRNLRRALFAPLLASIIVPAYADNDIEARVNSLLKSLSLEQKIGQMIQGEIQSVSPSDVSKYHLGSVLNGGGSFPDSKKSSSIDDWLKLADRYYEASINSKSGIPLLWGTDAVHGHNNVMGATLFPHNIGLGAANDPALIRKIGKITAAEVAVTGIDWVFAPTVAVAKDFRWGRTYEAYSNDSKIVRSYAGEIVTGLQGEVGQLYNDSQRVIATAKHFIGDGGTYRGVDQGNTVMSLEQLLEEHGQGYTAAIAAGVQTVMVSFNSWNGEKLHGHKQLLTDVLKGRMGFDGLVVSDWNGVGQVSGCTNQSCPQAINAGVDMIMVPHDWKKFYRNTLRQVRDGMIPIERIDDAVTRILRVKMRAGLFEKGKPSSREVAGRVALLGAADHRLVAREAVRKSLVLLKNDKQLLPLNPKQHLLVAGDGADNIGKQTGGWTLTWQGTENSNEEFPGATSIYAGLKDVIETSGGSIELSTDGSWKKKPDTAVVVFGEDPYAEGVGDRESLHFKEGYMGNLELLKDLKAKGIPVVSVFLTGRPLWMNAEINSSDAFVVAWLPGSEGGGVADVIVADANGKPRYDFVGKLSLDWPAEAINTAGEGFPVDQSLLARGQGLSYGQPPIIAANLNEDGMVTEVSNEFVVFSGTTRPPWKSYVGDSGNWRKLANGKSTLTTHGSLKVSKVDGAVQEDSRHVEWTAGEESQFYWQTDQPVDLQSINGENPALMMIFSVDKHPKGRVTMRMDCVWPCRGELNFTRIFRAQPEGKLIKLGVGLDCFRKAGVDLRKVSSPLVIATADEFSVTYRDVRIVSDASSKHTLNCS
ncbi:MAG: glycoside hydrolase family 3 N-terminal domain-containing protein [Porticoccaceae bacterium]